jgi:hypothetical protein
VFDRLRNCSFCFLCAVATTLTIFLLLSILLIGMKVPFGPEISVTEALRAIYLQGALPFLAFLGEFLKLTLPWSAAILLLVYLFGRDERLSRWLESVTSFEVPGVKVQRQGAQAVEMFASDLAQTDRYAKKLNAELEALYRNARSYGAELRARFKIDEAVAELARLVKAEVTAKPCDDFRLTLHVRDFVIDDRLSQLTEYYNGSGAQLSVGKTGRAFSVRYGVIGRVWRSGVPEVEGDLISPEERSLMESLGETLERFIARRWGLWPDEAKRIKAYLSYGAVRIERGSYQLGVIYFDSKVQNAFHRDGERVKKIQQIVNASPLCERLMQVNGTIIHMSRIRIYQTEERPVERN